MLGNYTHSASGPMAGRVLRGLIAVSALTFIAGCTSGRLPGLSGGRSAPYEGPYEDKPGAPLLKGLGTHGHSVSTESERAQRYFDQGLILTYGFNHAEAIRSFRQAAVEDPDCAICYWGEALALGPNINAPMAPSAAPKAWAALQKALIRIDSASKEERAYIRALETRYTEIATADRSPLDRAYAEAMRDVAAAYPDDLDAQVLFAEALMDTMPWDYYAEDGSARPATVEVIETLESVLAANPDHPGAIHLYIHIMEPSAEPQRAEAAADRLLHLVPSAGHLVHMPSHIYLRVGRYGDSIYSNELAAKADESYIAQCRAQGLYPAGYYPHNLHMLWASAVFEGRSALALRSARHLTEAAPASNVEMMPFLEDFIPIHQVTLARFGRWQDILETSEPPDALVYSRGMWRYTRGLAFANSGKPDEAWAELAALRSLAADEKLDEFYLFSGASARTLLSIADYVLTAELALARGEADAAVDALEAGVGLQDGLAYTEPPPWYFPVRHALGAVLLDAGRPAAAERVYREDLEKHPRNGWALWGLAKALRAQGQTAAAKAVEARFDLAWARADFELPATHF